MNNQIFFWFYSLAHQSTFFDKLIIFTAYTFPYLVIGLAIFFLLFHHEVFAKDKPWSALKHKWFEIFFILTSVVSAWLVSILLKTVFQVPRPMIQFSNVQALLAETDFSFPSGHATFYMALAVAIFLCHKKAGYLFLVFAIMIGIARIVAGVHFPLDILGGYLLGGVLSYVFLLLFKFKKQ